MPLSNTLFNLGLNKMTIRSIYEATRINVQVGKIASNFICGV